MPVVRPEDFVIYRGPRLVSAPARELWSVGRRCKYLLREDVLLPLSVDKGVLPVAPPNTPTDDVIELIVAVVPTYKSKASGAVDLLYGWFEQTEQQWLRDHASTAVQLGYDICDASWTSGLMNCGFEASEREALVTRWASALNEYHLFNRVEDADDYRAVCDQRVREHAPFAVVWLFATSLAQCLRRTTPVPHASSRT
jgi:hypothetical protein